jgi:hypothetical protein
MPSAVVIHGAGEPSDKAFFAIVDTFQTKLGLGWSLNPIWWGTDGGAATRIREGLPDTYPPRPAKYEARTSNPESASKTEGVIGLPWAIWRGRQIGLQAFATVFSDALRYWSNRDAIQKDMVHSIDPSPGAVPRVNVIAHSMGGVLAVDLAASGKVHIDSLVTFGTPVSVAHILTPSRIGLTPYVPGTPVTVRNIGRWTNIWNKYDPVGLRMGKVFKLADGAPIDRQVSVPTANPLAAHLAYWELEAVAAIVRSAIPVSAIR